MPLAQKINVPEGFQSKERKGEKIGGGFWVARRGRVGKRIKVTERPFEHPSYDSADTEAKRLKAIYPELDFFVTIDAKNVKSLITK